MNKNSPIKYIVILCISLIIFTFLMNRMSNEYFYVRDIPYIIDFLYKEEDDYDPFTAAPLEERLEDIEYYVKNGFYMTNMLYSDDDYETDFDRFWQYSSIEEAYARATMLKRAIQEGDASRQAEFDQCLAMINDYVSSTQPSYLHNYALVYADTLQYDPD